MGGFDPLDPDLKVTISRDPDLIWDVGYRSNGRGKLGTQVAAIARRSSSPRRRLAGLGRSRPSDPHPGRDQVLENAGGTRNLSRRSARRIGARGGASRGGGGSGSRRPGNALTRRERGRGKGHGRSLTTPGSCDDGLR
jgi:hypothetical protein